MDKYRNMSQEIGGILASAEQESQVQLSASARALVTTMRIKCRVNTSQTFLRELRDELESWLCDFAELDTHCASATQPIARRRT